MLPKAKPVVDVVAAAVVLVGRVKPVKLGAEVVAEGVVVAPNAKPPPSVGADVVVAVVVDKPNPSGGAEVVVVVGSNGAAVDVTVVPSDRPVVVAAVLGVLPNIMADGADVVVVVVVAVWAPPSENPRLGAVVVAVGVAPNAKPPSAGADVVVAVDVERPNPNAGAELVVVVRFNDGAAVDSVWAAGWANNDVLAGWAAGCPKADEPNAGGAAVEPNTPPVLGEPNKPPA